MSMSFPQFHFNILSSRFSQKQLRRIVEMPLTSKLFVYLGGLNYSWQLQNVLYIAYYINKLHSNTKLLYFNIGEFDRNCYRKLMNIITQRTMNTMVSIINNY